MNAEAIKDRIADYESRIKFCDKRIKSSKTAEEKSIHTNLKHEYTNAIHDLKFDLYNLRQNESMKLSEIIRNSGIVSAPQKNERAVPQTLDAGVSAAIKTAASNIAHYVREMGLPFEAAVDRAKDHSTLGSSSWQKVVELAKSKLGSALSEAPYDVCPTCHGTKRVNGKVCDDCEGTSHVLGRNEVSLPGKYIKLSEITRNNGAVWKTKSGKHGAKNRAGVTRYFVTQGLAQNFAKTSMGVAKKKKKNTGSFQY